MFFEALFQAPDEAGFDGKGRPVMIVGGLAFVLAIIGLSCYIKNVMKNDELEQARRIEKNKEKPRFKVTEAAVIVGIELRTESQDTTQSSLP